MRTSNHPAARQHETEFARGGGSSPAIRSHPRDPLRLPRKSDAPKEFVTAHSSPIALANLALALIDEGFLQEDEDGQVAQLVKAGLERVIEGDLGTPSFLSSFDINLGPTVDAVLGYEPDEEGEAITYWIGLDLTNSGQFCYVGEKVMVLEKLVPGLGPRVLQAVQLAAGRTFEAWTPETTKMAGAMIMWFGTDDQDEWLEEIKAMGADPSDFDLSPMAYAESFDAPWATSPISASSDLDLAALRSHEDRGVVDVAGQLEKIQALLDGQAMWPSMELTAEYEPAYRGALVRWSENDPMERILDDWTQHTNESCDCFTTLGAVWEVEPSREEFKKWLIEFRSGLSLYKALDELLVLISGELGDIE